MTDAVSQYQTTIPVCSSSDRHNVCRYQEFRPNSSEIYNDFFFSFSFSHPVHTPGTKCWNNEQKTHEQRVLFHHYPSPHYLASIND